jgi:F420-0:gamma-glutamyl ligase
VTVGGSGVAVGGSGVAVAGTGVAVGGTTVAVGGLGVAVGDTVAAGAELVVGTAGTGVEVLSPQAASTSPVMTAKETSSSVFLNTDLITNMPTPLYFIYAASPALPGSRRARAVLVKSGENFNF